MQTSRIDLNGRGVTSTDASPLFLRQLFLGSDTSWQRPTYKLSGMASKNKVWVQRIPVQKVNSVAAEIETVQQRVRERAYKRFKKRGGVEGLDVEDWLAAKAEIVLSARLNMQETDDDFMAVLSMPEGVDAKALGVFWSDQMVLVKSSKPEPTSGANGTSQQIFATICVNRPIQPRSIRADYENGEIRLTAKFVSKVGNGDRSK